MTVEEKSEVMKQIRSEIADLKASPLYEFRVKENNLPVIGEGSYDTDIMLIGEAPGKNEAATGRPFCGVSGRILDELLASISLPRKDVYVTNIVKDRPPDNRDPKLNEIALYAPFLDRQITAIKPTVIATLGRFSMEYVMRRYGLADNLCPISSIHGSQFEARVDRVPVIVVPLYHPAVAVYNGNMKDELKKDFSILKELVK